MTPFSAWALNALPLDQVLDLAIRELTSCWPADPEVADALELHTLEMRSGLPRSLDVRLHRLTSPPDGTRAVYVPTSAGFRIGPDQVGELITALQDFRPVSASKDGAT